MISNFFNLYIVNFYIFELLFFMDINHPIFNPKNVSTRAHTNMKYYKYAPTNQEAIDATNQTRTIAVGSLDHYIFTFV